MPTIIYLYPIIQSTFSNDIVSPEKFLADFHPKLFSLGELIPCLKKLFPFLALQHKKPFFFLFVTTRH